VTDAVRRVVGVSLNAAIDRIAVVDRLVPGGIHRPRLLASVPGGKAANAVRAAGHLGLRGSVVAVLAGSTGTWYREELAAREIPLVEVRVPGETRLCTSILDASAGRLTEFYERGPALRPGDWPEVERALAAALRDDPTGTVVILAGSLPDGTPADAYARLVQLAREAGARSVVDVGGEPLRLAVAARPWLVKVNGEEAASVVPGAQPSPTTPAEALAVADGLRGLGAARVVVTLGAGGAVLRSAEASLILGPIPDALLGPYSVGSGDAFTAGLLAGLSRGNALDDALRLAAAAGAASARMPGQGELDPDEALRDMAAMQVRHS